MTTLYSSEEYRRFKDRKKREKKNRITEKSERPFFPSKEAKEGKKGQSDKQRRKLTGRDLSAGMPGRGRKFEKRRLGKFKGTSLPEMGDVSTLHLMSVTKNSGNVNRIEVQSCNFISIFMTWLDEGEGNHITDVSMIGHKHDESINAHSPTTGRW